MSVPALQFNNVEAVYDNAIQALRGLSLVVPEKSIVALLGSNGAGKTTALKAVSGFLPLENGKLAAGSILFEGVDITKLAVPAFENLTLEPRPVRRCRYRRCCAASVGAARHLSCSRGSPRFC